LITHQRYAHAKQFKRAKRPLKKLRTYLGRVIRDIANDFRFCIYQGRAVTAGRACRGR
jgi:hypothetical protein